MSTIARPYLGELELAVLDTLWTEGPLDAKAAHRRVGARRGIGLNAVQSTLERLFRKQLLVRAKVSHAYVYTPAVRREELMGRLIEDVVETWSDGRAEPTPRGGRDRGSDRGWRTVFRPRHGPQFLLGSAKRTVLAHPRTPTPFAPCAARQYERDRRGSHTPAVQ